MRMLTGYWYTCTYSTLHQHKKTHLSMLTHMLVQTTEPNHAALSPPSGTEDNCIHDRIIFHFYSGFILWLGLASCSKSAKRVHPIFVHVRVWVYLAQSHQSRNPDRQKQQRALGVPRSHPTDHAPLNDLNETSDYIDASPNIWHGWAEHQQHLPSGRCQRKPSSNRSLLAAAWRIPAQWWRTWPGKCLRRTK